MRNGVMTRTLDTAIEKYLENGRLPSRKVNEIDNRGSSFYLALYWAEALASQSDDPELRERFAGPAAELASQVEKITAELLSAQGQPVDIGGYYMPDNAMAEKAMRPSPSFNAIIDAL